jgi:hypothetical protein
MTDHDEMGSSLILAGLENLTWLEKGVMVAASRTMLLGKTGFDRSWDKKGFGIYHGLF